MSRKLTLLNLILAAVCVIGDAANHNWSAVIGWLVACLYIGKSLSEKKIN